MDVDDRGADAGDDVGVGHHAVGGVDEAGALDALVAAVGAADAHDLAAARRNVGVGQEPSRARAVPARSARGRTARGSGGRTSCRRRR